MIPPIGQFGLVLADSSRALEIGKAAEYLVCADLLIQGYRAFPSDQGLPYDVVVDLDGKLLRLQVKSTQVAKNVNARGRNPRIAYCWSIRTRGKNGNARLTDRECDVVALVALNTRQIAYLPLKECGQTVQLSPSDHVKAIRNMGGPGIFDGHIGEFPFIDSISGEREYRRGALEVCPKGHPYTPENTHFSKGKYRTCRICSASNQRKFRGKRIAEAF